MKGEVLYIMVYLPNQPWLSLFSRLIVIKIFPLRQQDWHEGEARQLCWRRGGPGALG